MHRWWIFIGCVLLLVMVGASPSAAQGPTATSPPATSGEGYSYIAFVSERDLNEEIYVMNPDGSEQFNLTNHPGMDRNPTWSPDGSQIAFISWRDGYDLHQDVFVMNADGSNLRRLTNDTWIDEDLAWSPDGTQIAYSTIVSLADGEHRIFIVNADGSNWHALNENRRPYESQEGEPAWSPDGLRIAYTEGIVSAKIYIHDLATGENVLLEEDFSGETTSERHPRWTPAGQALIFCENNEAWIVQVPDPYITAQAGTAAPFEGPCDPGSWSPDGQWEVGVERFDTLDEIVAISLNGTQRLRLTENDTQDWDPVWSPAFDAPIAFVGTTYPYSPLVCPGSPPSRLTLGATAIIGRFYRHTPDDPLPLHNAPGGTEIGQLAQGTRVRTIDGPVCDPHEFGDYYNEAGFRWWKVETEDGTLEGWTIEGTEEHGEVPWWVYYLVSDSDAAE